MKNACFTSLAAIFSSESRVASFPHGLDWWSMQNVCGCWPCCHLSGEWLLNLIRSSSTVRLLRQWILLPFLLSIQCFWQKSYANFSALTLLVGRQEGHLACKNWVVRCWRDYLSGERCKWFVYGPADANVIPSSLAPVKSRMVYLTSTGLPRLSWKKAVKRV